MGRSKFTLTLESGAVLKIEPQESGDRAHAPGACPHCGATPFAVAGSGKSIEKPAGGGPSDTYRADGGCLACGRYVGVIRVKVSTLFGLEEDEAVARLGVRIY